MRGRTISTDTGGRALRVYVASSWRNLYQAVVVQTLRQDGHEVYDFRHPHMGAGAGGTGFDWAEVDPLWQEWTGEAFIKSLAHPVAIAGFDSDKTALDWCDALVFVQPCGLSSLAEAGWAAGAGKATYGLLAEGGEPELMYGLFDALFTDLYDVREELLKAGPAIVADRGLRPASAEG